MKFVASVISVALLACGPAIAQEVEDSSTTETEESTEPSFVDNAAQTITDAYNIWADNEDSILNQAQDWVNEDESESTEGADESGTASQQ